MSARRVQARRMKAKARGRAAGSNGLNAVNALAIDTASDMLSLALLKGGAPAGEVYESMGRRTTQEILPRIDALLRDAGIAAPELNLLLVARGPGSFTGTRIGMAVALTFAQVLGLPLLGVDTLSVLAAQGDPARGVLARGGPFHVLLNCARDEVYHARFRWEGGPVMEGEIALAALETVARMIGDAPVVLRRFGSPPGTRAGGGVGFGGGDPATKASEAAFAALNRLPLRHPRPDGPRLLAVGLPRFLENPAGPWPPVEPIYLKSEAFRTWKPAPARPRP